MFPNHVPKPHKCWHVGNISANTCKFLLRAVRHKMPRRVAWLWSHKRKEGLVDSFCDPLCALCLSLWPPRSTILVPGFDAKLLFYLFPCGWFPGTAGTPQTRHREQSLYLILISAGLYNHPHRPHRAADKYRGGVPAHGATPPPLSRCDDAHHPLKSLCLPPLQPLTLPAPNPNLPLLYLIDADGAYVIT